MAAFIRLDLGVPVEGVAQAALHLVRQHRLRRKEEARELLREQPLIFGADDEEVCQADARPGVPHAAPQEDIAAPPAGPILAPGPKRPRDVGVQAGPEPIPANPSWEELESGLMEARAMDYVARQRRAETFEVFDRYISTCVRPHASAVYWQRLIAAEREEADLQCERHDAKFVRNLASELSLQLVQHGPTHFKRKSGTWIDVIFVEDNDTINGRNIPANFHSSHNC